MRAAIPGHKSRGGSMRFGSWPTASSNSRSFIAPASPVAGAGRETAALSRCLLLYPRAQLVPQPHEDILGALFGVARVARQMETERVDTTGMLAVQLPKSGLVAGLGPGDEIVRHRLKMPSA